MNFLQNKTTRTLILIMGVLVVIGITISHFYYKNENQSIDPRIVQARTLYENYNKYAQNGNFDSVFILLDSIEAIYSELDHYKESYEMGVLYNNRAATYLTIALYSDSIKNNPRLQDSVMNLAENSVNKSINIYANWLKVFENKNEDELRTLIQNDFFNELSSHSQELKNKYLNKRIKEIQESQIETKRRLSVSYTNLGIIYRHKLDYKAAANYYKKAIDLWDRNLTAQNNLNILLDRPLKKQNFIQKLFPPDKN